MIKGLFILKKIQKGFTLIELILYMGLLSVLLLVLSQVFTTVLEGQINAEATSSVAQDGRYIYSRFIHDVHNADSVATPSALGEISESLVLSSNTLVYTYFLSNGNLYISDPTGTHQLNSFNTTVSDLVFQRIGNVAGKHTFQIHFTVTSKGELRGNNEIKIFQTTAGLR